MNPDIHGEEKSFDTEAKMRAHWVECHKISLEEDIYILVFPDSGKEPPMLVNLPMLDTPGASGELVKPPKAGGKKASGRASKLLPACFTAFSKLAAAPAAGSLEVDNTPHDQWEEEDN